MQLSPEILHSASEDKKWRRCVSVRVCVCLQRVCRPLVCACVRACVSSVVQRGDTFRQWRHKQLCRRAAAALLAAQRDKTWQHNTPAALLMVVCSLPDRWLSHRQCNRKPNRATPWLRTCFLLTLIDGSQVTAVCFFWFGCFFFWHCKNLQEDLAEVAPLKLNNPSVYNILISCFPLLLF